MVIEFDAKGDIRPFPFYYRDDEYGDNYKCLGWYDGPLAFRIDKKWQLIDIQPHGENPLWNYWLMYECQDEELGFWVDTEARLHREALPVYLLRVDLHSFDCKFYHVGTYDTYAAFENSGFDAQDRDHNPLYVFPDDKS